MPPAEPKLRSADPKVLRVSMLSATAYSVPKLRASWRTLGFCLAKVQYCFGIKETKNERDTAAFLGEVSSPRQLSSSLAELHYLGIGTDIRCWPHGDKCRCGLLSRVLQLRRNLGVILLLLW